MDSLGIAECLLQAAKNAEVHDRGRQPSECRPSAIRQGSGADGERLGRCASSIAGTAQITLTAGKVLFSSAAGASFPKSSGELEL